MPSHPGAVQDIRSAFQSNAISRDEASRLLKAEGLSDSQINAALGATARQVLSTDFATATALGIGQRGPDLRGVPGPITLGAGDPVDVGGDPFDTDPILNPDPEPLPTLPPTTAPPPAVTTPVAPGPTETPEERLIREALENLPQVPGGGPGSVVGPVSGGGVGTITGGDQAVGDVPPATQPGDTRTGVLDEEGLNALQRLQIELSATQRGRGTLFDQFRASQPLQSLLAQRVQQRRFNPLSAQFGLTRALNPNKPLNFAEFLRGLTGVSGSNSAGFQSSFRNLGQIFQPGSNVAGPSGLTEEEVRSGQRQVFEDPNDPNFARNAIIQGFVSQFAGLPGAAARAAGRRIDQFQGTNAGTPLFQAFLEGLLGQQGGGGFFGGFQQ